MSLENHNIPEVDDESLVRDIGRMLEVLLRQWRLIVAVVVVLALGTGLVSVLLPKEYRASAVVATTRVYSEASFGSDISIYSEEQLLAAAPGAYRLVDPAQRMQTYLELVSSPAIAGVVLEKHAESLKEEERAIPELLEMVQGEIIAKSDAIRISITAADPQLAADIANTWAEEYVRQINIIYSANANVEAYDALTAQTALAKADYERAQAELEAVIGRDRAGELQRLIDERQTTLESLSTARNNLLISLVTQRSDTFLRSYQEEAADLQERLIQAYADQRSIERLLDDVADMRTQVLAGGEAAAASNALALSLLKAQVFASEQALGESVQVQMQVAIPSAAAMIADLDGLLTALQTRQAALAERIAELSTQMLAAGGETGGLGAQAQRAVQASTSLVDLDQVLDLNLSGTPLDARLQTLEQEVRDLNAQLAQANALIQDQTHSRDLAYETYRNLTTKQAELGVVIQTNSTDVTLAAPAAAADKDLVSGFRNTLMAALLGAVAAILLAYTVEFWWAYKGVTPYPLLGKRKEV